MKQVETFQLNCTQATCPNISDLIGNEILYVYDRMQNIIVLISIYIPLFLIALIINVLMIIVVSRYHCLKGMFFKRVTPICYKVFPVYYFCNDTCGFFFIRICVHLQCNKLFSGKSFRFGSVGYLDLYANGSWTSNIPPLDIWGIHLQADQLFTG